MRTTFGKLILASALICVASAFSPLNAQGFKLTIPSTPDQYGLLDAVVENKSNSVITAVEITHSCPARNGISSGVGFDSLTGFGLGDIRMSPGLPPGQSMHFDVTADTASCPLSVGVLFADGHGEGSDWQQLLTARRTTYNELSSLVDLVKQLPPHADEFPKTLLDALNARYYHLRDLGRSEMTEWDKSARMCILDTLLQGLRPPRGPAKELETPDTTIATLERWMTPLANAIKHEQTPQ
jgi:hypothetical protein